MFFLIVSILILVGCGDTSKSKTPANDEVKKDQGKKHLKSEIITCEGSCFLWVKQVCNYDEKGNLIEEISYYKGGIEGTRSKYKFNDYGKKIEELTIIKRNPYDFKTVYIYEGSGRLIKETKIDGDQKKIYEIVYTYDSIGRLIKEDYFNTFTTKREYIYGEDNQVTGEKFYNEDDSRDELNYTYDERGNKTETIATLFPEKKIYRSSFKYDEKNNIIEELHLNPDGSVQIFSNVYKYNDEGNWIEKESYFSNEKTKLGELKYKSKKEISYYP